MVESIKVEISLEVLVTVSVFVKVSLKEVGICVVSGNPLDIKTQLFPEINDQHNY